MSKKKKQITTSSSRKLKLKGWKKPISSLSGFWFVFKEKEQEPGTEVICSVRGRATGIAGHCTTFMWPRILYLSGDVAEPFSLQHSPVKHSAPSLSSLEGLVQASTDLEPREKPLPQLSCVLCINGKACRSRRFPSSLSPYTAHLRLQAAAVPFLACPLPGDRAPTSRATGHVATAEPHGCVDGAQGTGIRVSFPWLAVVTKATKSGLGSSLAPAKASVETWPQHGDLSPPQELHRDARAQRSRGSWPDRFRNLDACCRKQADVLVKCSPDPPALQKCI
ncbi:hypothetical protein Anapl_15615 [Anas platyrhynchos]|uniref:Uncharacterized protein n=1 Tax=Anas platyrhynchos TaxID=8839 RepID=R0JA79_ANAPL|nr:hypothetical protein Anapl_15615 [Anas platyrhynchos]